MIFFRTVPGLQVLLLSVLCLVPVYVLAMDVTVLALFRDRAILKIDDKQRKLRTGETSPEGVKLISSDSEVAVLEINGKQQRYKLGSHITTGFSSPKHAEVRIMPVDGMYMTTGFINQQPVQFLVDTGATWIAMNAHHARQLGINFRYIGKKGMVSTANGVVPIYRITLDSVKVGDIELRHVDAGVLEGGSPSEVLLGNSFLNQVEMQRQGRVMLLKQKF